MSVKVSPRRDELFTDAERERLDQLMDSLALVAHDAFEHWLAALRWISGVAYIGEPRTTHPDELDAALQESATRHRFWLRSGLIQVQPEKAITMADWQSAQIALTKDKLPPIWFAFFI